MPNTKEKLLELSRQLRYCAVDGDCINCERWEFDCGSRKCLDDLLLKAAELLESVANGVTVQQWIPVGERLPDIDGKYLVAREECGRYSISVRKFRKEVPCWYTGYCGHWERRTNGITHWMPLPQPPKGE